MLSSPRVDHPSRRTLLRAAALALAAPACAGALPPSQASSLWGEPAPRLAHAAIDGRLVDSTALAGKVLVVDFFASYCKPCERTLPALRRLARRDRDLHVVGVGEDEELALVVSMAQRHGLDFPVLHDRGNVLAARFRVDRLPSTFVIDGGGRVRWVGGAEEDEDDLARVVRAVRR